MKESYMKFSFNDFLAYLFPGTVMLLSIIFTLLLTPAKQILVEIPYNFASGTIAVILAYFTGVIVSSFTYSFEDKIYKLLKHSDPIDSVQLPGFEEKVKSTFDEVFGNHGEWGRNHFFISRSIIRELAPQAAEAAGRQNTLRQLRRNSIIPIWFLCLSGCLWGYHHAFLINHWLNHFWGVFLIITSVVSCVIITYFLIAVGMHRNRKREVREICTAIILLPKLIAMKNNDK